MIMAKKKYDFKQDKLAQGVLNKLYMTPRQRFAVLRWSLFGLLLLVVSLLQDVILCRLDVFGATTDLVPCTIFLVTMLLGVEKGSVFALVSASMFQFTGSGPGYHAIALITVLCVLVSMFRQSYLRKGFVSTVLCASLCQMAYALIVFFVALLLGQTHIGRIYVAALTGGLSVLAMPLLYPVVRRIEKIGGESWKD